MIIIVEMVIFVDIVFLIKMLLKGVVVEVFIKLVYVFVVKIINREKLVVICCFKMILLILKGFKIILVFWYFRGFLVWLMFYEDYLYNFLVCNWCILSIFVEILFDKNCFFNF